MKPKYRCKLINPPSTKLQSQTASITIDLDRLPLKSLLRLLGWSYSRKISMAGRMFGNYEALQIIHGTQNRKWIFHPDILHLHESYPFKTLRQAVLYAAGCQVE